MRVYGRLNTNRFLNVTVREDAGVDSNQRRRCGSCGIPLSRYNADARCGACQRGLKLAPGFWEDPQVRQALLAWDLGTVCRLVRQHTGLSQIAFARLVSCDQSEVSRLERGQRAIKDRRKLLQWAQILGFPDHLAGPLPAEVTTSSPGHANASYLPVNQMSQGTHQLMLPAGQSITATLLPTLTLPADTFRGNELHLGRSPELTAWTRMPTRALVIGSRLIDGATRYFAVDARHGGQVPPDSTGADSDRLRIPAAYELDDLTYGVLWAVAGFDAALLGDDHVLHRVLPLVAEADLDPVAEALCRRELTAGSLMLVGSQASARYILDRRPFLGEAPVFWTRERSGEEAATWLFFSHKLDYLRRTAPGRPDDGSGRAFCIPEDAVVSSPTHERVLLFLAIALMESFGIRTWITADPSYADTEGFVLMPRQRAVIASWVRAEGVSKLAQTNRTAQLRTFSDAAGHAGAHSVTAADQARERLAATADYLGLDLRWLARRCDQLSGAGTAALAQPRNRLLGLEGLDTACWFVAHQFAEQNR